MSSSSLLRQLEEAQGKLDIAVSNFALLVSQAFAPYEQAQALKVRLDACEHALQNEVAKQVAIAVNTVDKEWHHKLQLQEAEYTCKIKLLEQELSFLKAPSRST